MRCARTRSATVDAAERTGYIRDIERTDIRDIGDIRDGARLKRDIAERHEDVEAANNLADALHDLVDDELDEEGTVETVVLG